MGVDTSEGANGCLSLSGGWCLDVDVGNVANVGVSWQESKGGDIEILKDELDVTVLVFSPRDNLSDIWHEIGVQHCANLGMGISLIILKSLGR